MADRVSAIRSAGGVRAHFLDKGFELAAPDVFQVDAFGPFGGSFIEVDGDSEFVPDLQAQALR